MRILLLTHRLPYAPNRGDRIRALYILRALAAHADVDLVSLVHDRDEQQHAGDLRDLTASVTIAPVSRWMGYARAIGALATGGPLTHALLNAQALRAACRRIASDRPPDIVLAYCSGMAPFALEAPLNRLPLVLDMVDVDSVKWRTLGETASIPARWIYAREARRLSLFEAKAARHARAVLVVNDRESESLLRVAPTAKVHIVPNGVALGEFAPPGPPADEPRVTFCGVMNYPPNEEGALWFARAVWPLIRARRPDARLSLVGSAPPTAVRQLQIGDATVEVTGAVADVPPYLWRSAVAVAPLFVARGVQNKVLEAVAAGLPCVVTPAVRDGLPTQVLPACLTAGDANEFASAVLGLLDRSAAQRRAMANAADVGSLGWASQLAALLPILEAASAPSGA
ncbi:MAG: TIGR03087 family PEP-CTERM/XrtA system glycosyltransferase [Acidobacteriota bacterium]